MGLFCAEKNLFFLIVSAGEPTPLVPVDSHTNTETSQGPSGHVSVLLLRECPPIPHSLTPPLSISFAPLLTAGVWEVVRLC